MPLYGYGKRGGIKMITGFNTSTMKYKIVHLNRNRTRIDTLYTGLTNCWKGFKISKAHRDYDLMEYYARGVNKFLRLLHLPEVDFDVLRLDYDEYRKFNKWVENIKP